jgi:hypothetical protein
VASPASQEQRVRKALKESQGSPVLLVLKDLRALMASRELLGLVV